LSLEGGAQPGAVYVTGATRFSEATRELQRTRVIESLFYIWARNAHLTVHRARDPKERCRSCIACSNAIAAVHTPRSPLLGNRPLLERFSHHLRQATAAFEEKSFEKSQG
jgi:hypothetical protein